MITIAVADAVTEVGKVGNRMSKNSKESGYVFLTKS